MEAKSFATYKASRKNLDDLKNQIKEVNDSKKKTDYTDERVFKYTKDKAGNAFVVMRFLPSTNDLPPVISRFSHFFDNKGKWFVEVCPTTIKLKCPCCATNSDLWNSGKDSDKEIVRRRRRKKEYYANVYIIKDSVKPENEGKVFIWQFGKKIYDKIMETLSPDNDVEKPVDIFDLYQGKNFKLKIKTIGGFSNYDQSSFSESGPLFDNDKELGEVYEKIHDLSEFIDPKNIKSEADLTKRLDFVLGDAAPIKTISAKQIDTDDSSDADDEPLPTPAARQPKPVIDEDSGEEDSFDKLTTQTSDKKPTENIDDFFSKL